MRKPQLIQSLLLNILSCIFLLIITSPNIIGQTTWTGNTSSNWATGSNWSAGVPDINDDVTIPDVTIHPIINTTSAQAKSILIEVDGKLVITSNGDLQIDGSNEDGIYNLGTVENSGEIHIGENSEISEDGIESEGPFKNLVGGIIYIDDAYYGISNFDTLINDGEIFIGTIQSTDEDGIYTDAVFINNNKITITNCSYGIYNRDEFVNNDTIILSSNNGSERNDITY